ncbi:MAG: hypothetical protein ACLQI7_20075 [Streptosporangiaceae bacterium]|jgi:hypothetical protein
MRRTLAAVITTVAAAAMISGTSLAAASARPASPASPASSAHSGIEHFQAMTTSATARPGSLIATGVFTAGGIDIVKGSKTDKFKFPGGSFTVRHHAVHTKQALNKKTCLFTLSQRGTYKLSRGTGGYARISGSGKYVLHILAISARLSSGRCTFMLLPRTWQQVITAQGPVRL